MEGANNIKVSGNLLKKIAIYIILITSVGPSIVSKAEAEIISSNESIISEESKEITHEDTTDNVTVFRSNEISSILITKAVGKLSIRPIESDGRNIILTVQNKNLYSGKYDNGYLVYGKQSFYSSKSMNYRTTKWFPVLAEQGKSLVLSGTAHNRATWQFMTADGKVMTGAGSFQKYKEVNDVYQDKTFSKIDIPKKAVAARVYFVSYKDDGADSLDNRMQIEYGKIPTYYERMKQRTYNLPSIKKGNVINLEDGKWTISGNDSSKDLDVKQLELKVGDILTLSKGTACEVKVTWAVNTENVNTGTYGVRWSINESNPVCERVGDAAKLHFNAAEGTTSLTPYQNDFDYIYPWSEIRVCAVKVLPDGGRKITYSTDEGFALDGSAGNIMVEIPKFYCKREIIDGYEYLWISPTRQEGFWLDPSFTVPEGEADSIYIGAYLSSIADNKLVSVSQAFPLIKRSLGKLRRFINNSDGFAECDLLSIMTVQRLYLVETAVLDSQAVFTGNVNMPYLLKDKRTSCYAIKSEKRANRIFLSKTNTTLKFHAGDAIAVLGYWNDYDNVEAYQRVITEINDVGNGTLEIKFTGKPVDIIRHDTGITCIPSRNGETDLIPDITGSVSADSGQSSFKYRGIENLWGNVSILLNRAYVKNSRLYIEYPDNKTVEIDYTLPTQNVQLSSKVFGNPINMSVKRMGYDKNNPLIMFPSEIGGGALTSSYYCDAWYNLAEKDVNYTLTYGGAWDNKGYAGIFCFRATFTENDAIPYNGSRIMLR
jgi:hypothetical protein